MILLKSILNGATEKEHAEAAKLFIYHVWRIMPKKDRFSSYQFSLWMDNEKYLQDLRMRLAEKLYPGDDEAIYTFFYKDVEPMLEKLEEKRYERMAKKIPKEDPLFILKSIVKDKTYEGAKQSLLKSHLSGWGYKGGRINDAEAEKVFERMYRHAMGETFYNIDTVEKLPKLSDLRQPNENKTEEIFVQQYSGYKTPNFPNRVKVFRGTNSPLHKIKAGDFVSFDRDYADSYSRGKYGAVVRDVLPAKELRVYRMEPDSSEMVYWPEGHKLTKYSAGTIPTFKEFWGKWH